MRPAIRNRVIAILGRVDKDDPNINSVFAGLIRATGSSVDQQTPSIDFDASHDFGDLWDLQALWDEIGFGELRRVFRNRRRSFETEPLLRMMPLNQLCDPRSTLGMLLWLHTVSFPKATMQDVAHTQLLRAMDDWVELESKATDVIARLIRPLIDTHLSVVFYDLTTIEASGESEVKDDLRAHGRSKRDRIERQLASGLVQTAEGLPIANEIFEGNVAEVSTLRLMVEGVLERFDIKRVVLVADRGLLLMDNLEALGKIRLPSDCPLKFVPAVPARRDRIRTLEDEAPRWVPKLDAQHQDSHSHGRKLSCYGAKARLVHAVAEAHRGSILQLDLRSHLLTWDIHRAALKRHETLDGKLVLLTNTPDLSADEVVECFMSQADIERGFRVLKSEIGISPLFHRSPDRIRLHACICFLALVLHRVVRMRVRLRVRMRVRLRKADAGLSSASSLGVLHQIQRHRISLNDTRVVRGLCTSMTSRRASQRVNNRA